MSSFAVNRLAALMVIFSALASARAEPPPRFQIIDLGTLPGGNTSYAVGINNRGDVIGIANTASGDFHTFLYSGGVVIDLATLPGHGRVPLMALDINDEGEILLRNRDFISFSLYSRGEFRNLNLLSGDPWFQAFAINNHSVVAGWSIGLDGFGVAATYSNAVITFLGGLCSDCSSTGLDINDHGDVVGFSNHESDGSHAVLFAGREIVDIGIFAGGGASVAYAVNNLGHIVGLLEIPDQFHEHAFLYCDGMLSDLGTLPGDVESIPSDINVRDEVIGISFATRQIPRPERPNVWNIPGRPGHRPFLYSNGKMYDLNTLVMSQSGWRLVEVAGINDKGQIVGAARYRDQEPTRAWLLNPL